MEEEDREESSSIVCEEDVSFSSDEIPHYVFTYNERNPSSPIPEKATIFVNVPKTATKLAASIATGGKMLTISYEWPPVLLDAEKLFGKGLPQYHPLLLEYQKQKENLRRSNQNKPPTFIVTISFKHPLDCREGSSCSLNDLDVEGERILRIVDFLPTVNDICKPIPIASKSGSSSSTQQTG